MNGLGGIVRFCDGTIALALDDFLVCNSLRLTPSNGTLSPQVYWLKVQRHSIDNTTLRIYAIFTESQLIVLRSIRAMEGLPRYKMYRCRTVEEVSNVLYVYAPIKAQFSQPPFQISSMLTADAGALWGNRLIMFPTLSSCGVHRSKYTRIASILQYDT